MTYSKTIKAALYPLQICVLLTACGRGSTEDNSPPIPPADVQPPLAVEAEPGTEVVPEPLEDPAPINLSRDLLDDILDEQPNTIRARERTLPAMFDADADDKKTTIGGSLMLKDEPTQIREMVDGIEVKIEIPTG